MSDLRPRRSWPAWAACAGHVAALREVALPRSCCGCAAPATWWCPDCAADLAALPPWSGTVAGVPAAAAAPHEGAARLLMLAFKQRRVTAAAEPLARLLLEAFDRVAGPAPGCVVRVPAAPGSRWSRGFDPVAELCRRARLSGPALRWARRSSGQKWLGREARRHNRDQSLRAPGPLADVIVVDDVMTTGATLAEAVRAVRAAGGHVRAVVAVTRTPAGVAARRPVGRLAGRRD